MHFTWYIMRTGYPTKNELNMIIYVTYFVNRPSPLAPISDHHAFWKQSISKQVVPVGTFKIAVLKIGFQKPCC